MTIEQKNRLLLFPRIGKYIIIFFAVALLVVGARAYQLYQYIFAVNVKSDYILLIYPEDAYTEVDKKLRDAEVFIKYKAFKWVAKKKSYPTLVKPGRYALKKGMNTNQVVNMLRNGTQQAVKLTFNNIRLKEDLAGKVSKYILADSLSILEVFNDNLKMQDYGFTPETYSAMFIPNTYEMYWTSTANDFTDRMKTEYDRFWNEKRKAKAAALEMTPVEVTTLASVVQAETAKNEELKRVAGLYINRLRKGQPLQADPTVKFAVGDFTLRRILNKHLEIDSPYNTYKYAGLPPGPINFPEVSAIDAVLNYEKHNYYYMCAKEDFSGYHNFAKTLRQHNRNAHKYKSALNAKRIYK